MNRKMRLHPGVFYRRYDDFVVLFHTGLREVFTFNLIAADIFDCFKKYANVGEVINALGTTYSINGHADFAENVRNFIQDILTKGILQVEYKNLIHNLVP
jgi:hypothetical protein